MNFSWLAHYTHIQLGCLHIHVIILLSFQTLPLPPAAHLIYVTCSSSPLTHSPHSFISSSTVNFLCSLPECLCAMCLSVPIIAHLFLNSHSSWLDTCTPCQSLSTRGQIPTSWITSFLGTSCRASRSSPFRPELLMATSSPLSPTSLLQCISACQVTIMRPDSPDSCPTTSINYWSPQAT